MNNEIVKDYIVYNGNTIKSSQLDLERLSIFPGVYEVIRIIDGVPLFIERHLSRFESSTKLLGFDLQLDSNTLRDYINQLILINECNYGNVKIIINNLNRPIQDNYFFFIKSKYPTQIEIENGVPTILFYGERNNPNAKTTDLSLRERINQEIYKHNAYEALLVNKENEITEGSRSNVFIVKNNFVYTPPAKNILQGVTRGYILEICKGLGYDIIETHIDVRQLPDMDGLFLTGTSPQVLPISSVDGIKYASSTNNIINKIRVAYEDLVSNYITIHK